MIRKIILCFVGALAMYAWMPAVYDVPVINTVQAKELEQHIWFYSDHGMDYWITAGEKNDVNTYNVCVTQTHNGKMGVFHIYDVKCENGIAYTNLYDRRNGTWGGWEHNDFAQALWNACTEYL